MATESAAATFPDDNCGSDRMVRSMTGASWTCPGRQGVGGTFHRKHVEHAIGNRWNMHSETGARCWVHRPEGAAMATGSRREWSRGNTPRGNTRTHSEDTEEIPCISRPHHRVWGGIMTPPRSAILWSCSRRWSPDCREGHSCITGPTGYQTPAKIGSNPLPSLPEHNLKQNSACRELIPARVAACI